MRHRVGYVSATGLLVVLATLSGCSGDAPEVRAASGPAPSAPASVPSADPTTPAEVPYAAYREAAVLMSIRPDLITPETAFEDSLHSLCARDADGFADLRREHRASAGSAADGSSAYRYLGDEAALRVDLACPQRMSDWLAAREDVEGAYASGDGDGGSTLTAEEAGSSAAPVGLSERTLSGS